MSKLSASLQLVPPTPPGLGTVLGNFCERGGATAEFL